jgi:hypothetical protein
MEDRALIIVGVLVGVITLGVLIRVSSNRLTAADILAASGFAAGAAFTYWVMRKDGK